MAPKKKSTDPFDWMKGGLFGYKPLKPAPVPRKPKELGIKIAIVYSGKGGVGKSTTTSNLYKCAVARGLKAAILDADINTPSINLLAEGEHVYTSHDFGHGRLITDHVIKMWFRDCANKVVKAGVDILFVDMPPSISALHTNLFKIVRNASMLMVTQPHDLSRQDNFRASVTVKDYSIKTVGTLVNMCEESYQLQGGEVAAVPFAGKLDSSLPLQLYRDTYESVLDILLGTEVGSFEEAEGDPSAKFDETITIDTILKSFKNYRKMEFVNLSTWEDVVDAIEDNAPAGLAWDRFLQENNTERLKRLCDAFSESRTALFMCNTKIPPTETALIPLLICPCTFERSGKYHYNVPCVVMHTPWGQQKLFAHEVIPVSLEDINASISDYVPMSNGGYFPKFEAVQAIDNAFGVYGGWEEKYSEVEKYLN